MEFVILVGAVVVGFFSGWNARELYAIRKIDQLLKQVELTEEPEKEDVERMTLEKHGNVIYAFTSSHEFIAQGSTLEELDAAIQKRFPGRKFLIKESNLNDLELKA